MGKLTLILGGLLIASVAGSAWYIDRLLDEISVLKANAIVLETKIAEQNESIKIIWKHKRRYNNKYKQ